MSRAAGGILAASIPLLGGLPDQVEVQLSSTRLCRVVEVDTVDVAGGELVVQHFDDLGRTGQLQPDVGAARAVRAVWMCMPLRTGRSIHRSGAMSKVSSIDSQCSAPVSVR